MTETGPCAECGAHGCGHRAVTSAHGGNGLSRVVRLYVPIALCAACGRGPESTAADTASRGAVVLYETEAGAPAYFHRVCAAELMTPKPVDTLPPVLHWPTVLRDQVELRHVRRRVWAHAAERKQPV